MNIIFLQHSSCNAPEMQIKVKAPGKLLQAYVKTYWSLVKDNTYHCERIFPSGEPQLIFHLEKPFTEINNKQVETIQPVFSCCGQLNQYKDIISTGHGELFGVVFQTYALPVILGVPAGELTTQTIDLCDIDRRFAEIGRRLQETKHFETRVKLFENFIIRQIDKIDHQKLNMISRSLTYLSDPVNNASSKQLSGQVGISERHLERLFHHYVGMSPRSMAGIMRFKRSLQLIERCSSLTKVTYEAGYYDQAQFIRTFKTYTGITPGQYRRQIKNAGMSE